MSPPPDKACPRCDTLLRYIARRTVRTASSAYYLHVRACPGCGCAYGDTQSPSGKPLSMVREQHPVAAGITRGEWCAPVTVVHVSARPRTKVWAGADYWSAICRRLSIAARRDTRHCTCCCAGRGAACGRVSQSPLGDVLPSGEQFTRCPTPTRSCRLTARFATYGLARPPVACATFTPQPDPVRHQSSEPARALRR